MYIFVTKCFTTFKVSKSVAETVILSKINYSYFVYDQLPAYLKDCLKKYETGAWYVFEMYTSFSNNMSLNWLPVVEDVDFDNVKCE